MYKKRRPSPDSTRFNNKKPQNNTPKNNTSLKMGIRFQNPEQSQENFISEVENMITSKHPTIAKIKK